MTQMNEEEKLNKAMDDFVDAAEFDNKLMTWHIIQMAFWCVGIVLLFLVIVEEWKIANA